MNTTILGLTGAFLTTLAIATPAAAQTAGDGFVKLGVTRTKLADEGTIAVNGVVAPGAGYETRATKHFTLSAGYFPIDSVALEVSATTPVTTNNIPTGTLAGTPNLGDDTLVMLTAGGSFHPFHGAFSPYVGGGYVYHITTAERDGLAVNLRIPNSGGPYLQAGADYSISDRWGVFAEVRKGWFHSNSTAKLPLDATYTQFADVAARAVLDPLSIQIGFTAHFSGAKHQGEQTAIGPDTTKWTLRPGITQLNLANKAELMVGGAPYPGAGISTFEHHTLSLQVGRYLTRNIAVNLTVGIPPTIDIYAAGSIGALPKLGKVTYGPMALTAQFHPLRSGRIRPYVGVGLSYMMVFGTKDGAFQDLKVDNDFAPAFEAGSDFMISQNWALFANVKKALLRPKAYGTFAGMPVVGQTRLDPWAFSGGVAYHF